MHLTFSTAGESHGKALVALVEGLPAGLPVSAEWVDRDLLRRMQGYGRGARMKIERDHVEWLSGVRAGETLGSPVAMLIPNRDWSNWEDVMAHEAAEPGELRRRRVTRPRPGHADLVGVLKYDRVDARDILERASARETTARVAAGALARRLLDEFGVEIGSHVVSLGGVAASPPGQLPVPLNEAADRSEVRVLDPGVEAEIIRRIDAARKAGRHARRRGGGRGARAGRGAGQPRELGPQARRPAGGNADVDPGGEGGRDRAGRRGGAPARLPVHDPIDPGGRHAARRRATRAPASAAAPTTPAASRAGSPPASRW